MMMMMPHTGGCAKKEDTMMYTDRKTDGATLTHNCPVVKSNTLTRPTAPFTALSELTAAPYSSTSLSSSQKTVANDEREREKGK